MFHQVTESLESFGTQKAVTLYCFGTNKLKKYVFKYPKVFQCDNGLEFKR